MVKYLPPFLTNFQMLSYKNHICINQSTEDAYLYNTLILGAKNAWCKTIVIHHYRLSTTCWSVAPGWKGSDGPPDPSRPSDFFFEIGSYRPEGSYISTSYANFFFFTTNDTCYQKVTAIDKKYPQTQILKLMERNWT